MEFIHLRNSNAEFVTGIELRERFVWKTREVFTRSEVREKWIREAMSSTISKKERREIRVINVVRNSLEFGSTDFVNAIGMAP